MTKGQDPVQIKTERFKNQRWGISCCCCGQRVAKGSVIELEIREDATSHAETEWLYTRHYLRCPSSARYAWPAEVLSAMPPVCDLLCEIPSWLEQQHTGMFSLRPLATLWPSSVNHRAQRLVFPCECNCLLPRQSCWGRQQRLGILCCAIPPSVETAFFRRPRKRHIVFAPRRSPRDVEGCCMLCMWLHHTSRWARGMVPNPLGERLPCGRIERIILIN